MIGVIKTKALRRLYAQDQGRGLPPEHVRKLRTILHLLDEATRPDDLNLRWLRLKPLKGDWEGYWQIDVSGNYRVRFRFEENNVTDVHYGDWH